uniref:Uncharacterized protein n=1 Tax=Anguilla anguilla TaxID=7936 RepID=A0A0E9VQJ6_ANGAN
MVEVRLVFSCNSNSHVF